MSANSTNNAVSNRLKELKIEEKDLLLRLGKCNYEFDKLSKLSEDDRYYYLDLDINLYPDISSRVKTILCNYGKRHNWPTPITPRFIYNRNKSEIAAIRGIGLWSIAELDGFFMLRDLSWD